MDLIATERLVSTLKKPQGWVLCSSHLASHQRVAVGGILGRLEYAVVIVPAPYYTFKKKNTYIFLSNFLNNVSLFYHSEATYGYFKLKEQTLERPVTRNELRQFDLFEVLLRYIVVNYSAFLNARPNDSVKWPFIRFKS